MPGKVTQGRRLPDGFHYRDAEPGDFWRQSHRTREEFERDGITGERGHTWDWCVRDPDGALGTLAAATETHQGHHVTEHEDGTISVTPSILRPDSRPASEQMGGAAPGAIAGPGWHGYLERGVWTEV